MTKLKLIATRFGIFGNLILDTTKFIWETITKLYFNYVLILIRSLYKHKIGFSKKK